MVHTILKVTALSLMVGLLYGTGPGKAYAWFYNSSEPEGLPVFERTKRDKTLSDRYAVLPNKGNIECGLGQREFAGDPTRVTAGELNIDIPFNLLKKMVVNTEGLLDRHIAANLTVKNLLEEYLAAKKRNAELLKDLSIPYLDGNDRIKKKKFSIGPGAVEPAYEIKKKLADVIYFHRRGTEPLPIQKSLDFQVAWYGEKKHAAGAVSSEEILSSASETGYAREREGAGRYTTTYGHETQLPWVFSFGLKLLKYVVENRIVILIWTVLMVMGGMIGLLVAKR